MSQEPNGNCSEKLVQMNFFISGGFFRVDFPPVNHVEQISVSKKCYKTQHLGVFWPGSLKDLLFSEMRQSLK